MRKFSKARLFSTCLTGAVLAAAMPAWAQTSEAPTWKPRAEVDAQVGENIGVSTSLFAPIAQNDSGLVYVDGRIGYDQRFDRNGSATVGARFRMGEDTAIGVNVGADFYRSDIGKRDQAAVSMGLEGFSSVFDVRVNYRLPLSKTQTIGYIDPAAAPSGAGALTLENNRLIERYSGFRLEAIPLRGFNGEAGVRLPVGDNASIRGSVGGFDYRDSQADDKYRGYRVGLEMDVEDANSGARFTFGGALEHTDRYGTDARATVRLSVPFGGRASDRGAVPTGLDRQMGDRVRRDYVARSGSRYTDLTSTRLAVDARTGNQFGSFFYASGTGAAGAAGTIAAPTTLGDAVTRAGTNGVVVALGSGGNINTAGVTLATDQYLVGGASAVDVRLRNGSTVAYGLGGTNGVVVGTAAGTPAVTLGQGSVVRDVTVRGAGVGIAANGVGGFALDRVVIENTGGAGLSLTNTLGSVALTGLTVRGGAGAGVLINGGNSVSLANSTISGGAGAVDINDGGANVAVALSTLTLSATGGNVLDIDGSGAGTVTVTGMSGIAVRGGTGETGGVSVRSATFDANTTTAGIQTVNAGRMEVGTTAARVNGQGVFLTDVTGSLSFADLDIANSNATGLRVANPKANDFTLATLDGTIDTVGGTAANLDPLTINLTFAGMSSVGAAGPGVILDTVQGGGTGGNALTIGTLTVSNSGAEAFVILNSTGLVRVNGGTVTGSGGSAVRVGTAGVAGSGGSVNLVFGAAITDTAGAAPIVALFNTSGTISFTGPITGTGTGGIVLQDLLAGASVNFGVLNLTGTIGDAISLNNLAGAVRFNGLVTIANPTANGIVIGNVPGGVTFGDVDITGLGDFTGLDVRATQGTVLFNTLDISGTGVGTGIDVTGSTNSGNVIVLTGSVIQNVDIGVDLTNAAMTGQFRFGDGDGGTMNSRITANTPIVIAGMNTTQGSYNFADVMLQGDITNITGTGFTAYYAQVGATGGGTRDDPGSLAGAEASGAQYIVLLNDGVGAQDVFDATTAGGSFDLAAGQALISFLNQDFFAVSGASMPANLILTGVGPSGITNPYAGSGGAVLTTTLAGSATVNLATNSSINGLVIRNAAGDVGVEGSGVSNVRILNSDISGAAGAIAISDGGAASSVQLTNLDLTSTSGVTLALNGAGAGTLSVSASNVDIAATGNSAALSIADVESTGISFGSITAGTSATGAVSIQNVSGGGVAIGSIAVAGTTTGEGISIEGASSAISIGSISVAGTAEDAVRLVDNSGAIDIDTISAGASGVSGDGVQLTRNGTVSIGALVVNGANAGLAIEDSLGDVTIGDAAISGVGSGVIIDGVGAGSAVSIGDLSINGTSAAGISLSRVEGSVTFTGTTDIAGVGTSGIVLGAGSTGTINFGDVNITGLAAGTTGVMARAASGTIAFNTLDITGASTTGTRGIDLTGATFATSLTVTESSSITGVGIGVDLTNAAITGSFRYGDGSNTDADGAASSIVATVPIEIAGLNAAVGTYNFADVVLTGDTSRLVTSAATYYVKAGALGAGTLSDPGSLAGAEASSAQIVVLLNDSAGGQDVLDAVTAGGSFDLAAGQSLLSFLNGDTLTLPGGSPANLVLYGITPGQVTNPFAGSGAPILTTSLAGANTVTLGGGNILDGLVIQTGATGGRGVRGDGVANVVIRNSVISGQSGAIFLSDGGAAANAALSNLVLGSSGGVVLTLNGTGGGTLTLTALSDITIEGGNGEIGGMLADAVTFDADLASAGAQAVVGTLNIGAAGARVDGFGIAVNSGAGSLDLTSLNVFNANGVGVSLDGLTAVVRGGAIDTNGDMALTALNAALTLDFAGITATGGGIFMTGNSAANAGEPVLNVGALSLTDGGLTLTGSGDYVFANASITHNIDVAVVFGGQVNLDYAGDITSGAGASATIGTLGHTGTASFHDGTIDVTDGDGFQFADADGSYSFTGTATLHGGNAGINIASGSSGTFVFGAGTSVTDGAIANFALQNSDADVTYLGSLSQGLATDNLVVSGQTGGTLDFSQATIAATAGSGLLFIDADGTTTLGDVVLSGGAGIAIVSGSAGTIGFGNVDITGLGANQTAVDLTGALGNVTFATLDIAGTSTTGSKGIDLTGSATAANIIVSESSNITGVGIGVDLTNAAITGNFRFGDGSSADADGAASTISASVPIEIAGLNGGVGSYNFADVNLIGDTSRLVTSATTYFVKAGATGAGTMADPGSLAGAEASGAQILILLNDPAGGQDVLDVVDAGGSFDIAAGQSLLGFLNGDTLTLPGGGPTNLIVFGLTPGQIVNPFTGSGAPILTSSGGGDGLVLASNTIVDGILIDIPVGIGIYASGAANVTIRNSVIGGGSGAIVLADGGLAASAALTNLQLASGGNAVLSLDGTGAGTLAITALDDIRILGGNGETLGLSGRDVLFDADLTTAGIQAVTGTLQIGTTAARIGGRGLYLDGAEGTTDFTLDIATDGGAGIYALGGAGGLQLGIAGGTVDVANAGGDYGVYLENLGSAATLGALDYAGTGVAVWTQNVTGVGAGGLALYIARLTVADGAGAAIRMTGSASGSFSFGAASSIGTTAGAGAIWIDNSGASALNYAGGITYAGANAAVYVAGGHTGTIDIGGTIDATSGTGLVFDNADGTYNFTGTANLAAGVRVINASTGSFAFGAGTTITDPSGTGIEILNSTASLGYAGTLSYGSGAGAAINIVSHSGGTIAFTGLVDITSGTGIAFDNADGIYSFTGTTTIDAGTAGIVVANGSAGTFTFGSGSSVTAAGAPALQVSDSSAAITYLGALSASGAGNGLDIVNHTGELDFTLATLDLSGGTTLGFDNADGIYRFGSFATTGGATIAILNGSAGAFTFGDVDLAGIGAGQAAIDLTGATGNVTFQTLDITGTGGTGIDLTGSTTAANIIVSESSNITGLDVGVDLTNAAITGSFRYGDGSNLDADGAASSISAVTPLVITGLNGAVGTYDFADVVLTGDTSTLQTNKTMFWVQAGATGAGTRSDPGSLAAAEASGAQVIILLDTQIGAGQDVIDGASAGGGFDLNANQSLLGFLNGDTLTLGGGAPANLLLFGIAGGTVTNPYAGSGAALLTTSQAGATTVNLASGAVIDGVEIGNLDWRGVYGAGVVGATVRNSVIHGGVSAIQIVDNGASASVALNNLTLSSDTGDVLALLRTGAGQLTVTQLADITIAGGNSGAGLNSFEAIFDADLATAGIQAVTGTVTVGSAGSRVGGAGLVLEDATGALNLTTTIYNTDDVGLFALGGAGGFELTIAGGSIDTGLVTTTGSALYLADLLADIQLASVTYAGPASGVTALNVTGVGAGGRALDIGTLTVASGANRGIFLDGTTSGNFSFGAGSSIVGTTAAGIELGNSGTGSLNYLGNITGVTAGALVSVTSGHIGTASFSGTLSATGGTGLQFDNADGTYTFSGTTTLNGGDAGIDIVGGSAGTFAFGTGTSVTSPSGTGINIANSTAGITYSGNLTYATAGQAAINVVNHSAGTIAFQTGTINATNGTGLQFDNADGTYNFTGTTTLNGGDAGIDIVNGSAGIFAFGTGTAITSPSGTGINIANSTAGITYSGNLTYATAGQAAINVLNHSGGTITFQTGTINATNGTGLQFDNADGTYNFTGTTTLNGGDAGIDIVGNSGGTFTFGAGTSITSPSGVGINIDGSTASVSYAGNLTYGTAGVTSAINISNHSVGTVAFQIGTINVTGGNGINISDADGTYTFSGLGGTTTLGGNASAIWIGSSNGTVDFGAGTTTNYYGLFVTGGSQADITYSGTMNSGAGNLQTIYVANGDLSTIDLTLATLNIASGAGIGFDDADGTYQFGSFALSGGATIAVLNGSAGTLTFGDVDITGLGANQTAVNLTGATGNVTFATLDITGTSATGSKGIDLTGNTGTGNIVTTDSGSINGVGIGVDLTNANRTGLFRYGDGASNDADSAASSISATTPLVITGLNGGAGTYNFADVNLIGDTSGLATSATVFYVLAGATGVGTMSDPGSLAAAEAAVADFIILLNDPNGGQDVLDALGTNGDDSLLLDINQALRSFRNGDTIALPGGAPVNVILTGVTTGSVTNRYPGSGAPILTTTGAANTVTLANGSSIDGVIIQSASAGAAIYGSGASGVTVSKSTLLGTGGGFDFRDGGVAADATLTDLIISLSGNGPGVALSGTGAGTVTLTGSGISVSNSGSGYLASFDDVIIGAGDLSFGAVSSSSVTSAGVDLNAVSGGALSFTSIAFDGTLTGIDLTNSSAAISLGDVTLTGAGVNLASNSGAVTIGTVDITGGSTGIAIGGQTAALTIGNVTIDGAGVAGLTFGSGNTGTINFGNVDIAGVPSTARGVDARSVGAGNVTFATLDITGASATGTRGIDLTGNAGTGDFIVSNGSNITGVGIGVDLTNAARTGDFQYGDGESTIDRDSKIIAVTPIVITGIDSGPGAGTYNFLDVVLTGDKSGLQADAFFVSAGGTGIGTRLDPASLAAADASTAAFIVLLDSQVGAGSFDTITGALSLADGQTLLSFRDVDEFTVASGAPGNVQLYDVQTGKIVNVVTGSGAPLLTSTNALGTIQLGGTSTIDGVVVSNTGTGAGIYANGTAGTATIRNSTISGGGAGIDIRSGAATRVVNLQNLALRNAGNNAGALLNLNGTGGTLTVTGMSNFAINTSGGETAGLIFNTVTFDSNLATPAIDAVNAGAFTIGTSGARVQGDGLSLTNVSGALTFTDIDIANNGGTGLLVANSKANNFLLTTLDGSVDTTNGTAVNLDPLVVEMELASIDASGGAWGVLLDQVQGNFTVTGAVNITGATTAGVAIQNNTAPLVTNFNGAVTINNTTGAGLSLTNNTGATIAFAGGGTGVDVVTTSGAGLVASGGGTISFAGSGNSIQTATGQVLSLANVTAAAGGVAFGSLASTGTVAGATAINLNNLDGGGFSGGTVSIAGTSGATSDGIFIGGGSNSTISFGATTIAATGDEGVEINGAGNGAVTFSSVTIDDTAGDGVLINGATESVTINAGAIGGTNDPSGNGVFVNGGSGNVTINAAITKTSGNVALAIANRAAGTLSFGGNIAASGTGLGVGIDAVTGGSVTVSGNLTLSGNQNLIQVRDSAAAITFSGASKSVTGTALQAVNLTNNTGSTIAFTGGGLSIGGTTATALNASGGGTLAVTGSGNTINGPTALNLNAITVGAPGLNFASVTTSARASGIALTNVASSGGGAITLGTVNLQGITSAAISVDGTLGAALNITDLDIGLNNAAAIGLDLNAATLAAGITAGDFDLTNAAAAGTTIGVDLRGTTGGQVVRLGDASAAGAFSTISGVATGVWLNAGTNAAFTYGDGEFGTDGTSTISATTAIDATAAPATGNYDFRDVTFGASPGLGFGVGRTLFVDSDGSTGGGNGSGGDGANPMTLATAELALAATDVIVLINNGAAISVAGSNGNDTLALVANTQVRGFGQGPLSLTLTVPSTILLSSGTVNIADPTGNGAATLTTAAGGDVITLGASGNRISGFILDGAPGGALRGIVDNGGATGTLVNFMTIRNFNAVGGYGVEITPSTNSTINNVSLTGNTNDLFLNAAGSTISNVTAIGATGISITLNNATGTTALTNVNISGAATGLSFTTPAGTINATNVDIAGAGTSALTVSGGTASLNFDAASSIVQAAGGLVVNFTGNHTTGTFAYAGLINASSGAGLQFNNADGTYNFTGTTTLNGGNAGIDIYNGATGTFAFGSGTTLTHNGAGNAFSLLSSANVTYDGTITDNNGIAVEIDGHDAGTATFNGAISSSIANASTVVSVINSNAGTVAFNGQMNIASTGTVVSLSGNDGSTVTFNAGGTGLDITSTAGTGMLITGGGTVNVQGSGNSIATTSGTLLSIANPGATATSLNLAFASAANTSGANGILVNRAAGTLTGSVAIAGGGITATTRGVSLTGDALTFSYGGTITTSGGAARSVEATSRTGGTAMLSGNVTDTSLGIRIADNSASSINFTGQSISLSTGANDALTLSNNVGTTINFASAAGGNGVDIVTSSGIGLNASGGGALTITGSGNSIQTATGQILSLSGVLTGAAGITFDSLQSTGTVTGIAINFNNFDNIAGGAFSGGTTSIAATTGGDGIFIGNGSNANIGFGATTIGTTAGTIGGDGIEVNGSGNGSVTFASVDIDGTTAHGVNVTGAAGATGAVSINGGTIGATASSAGDGVNLTGGGTAVNIAAAITKTNIGNIVEVSNRAAGAATFSGNLSATGGVANGILLSNNSGGTITFSGASKVLTTGANNAIQFDNTNLTGATVSFTGGGLAVTTGNGRGITATSTNAGAGSLAITGAGNSINSAGGFALNLVNTNIAASGVNFQSVSANGGVRGILLNTTGGAGGLTITGTGTTDGSGGTIQNIGERGIELRNTALVSIANLNLTNASTTGQAAGSDNDLITANGAIFMNGVATAVFNNVDITGTIADNGITGINVSNFQFNNGLIDNAGDGANESGIEFINLSGTSSLTNTEIRFSETNSLDIYNTDVNLNLTLNNVIFRDTQSSATNGEGGFQFRSFSNAAGAPTTNIDILDSDFLRLRTQAIQVIGEDDSIVNIDITNNVINVDTGIGTGIDINGNDTATVNFNIISNPTIRASGGAAINITSFLSANVMGRITNNANITVFSQSGTSNASGTGVRLLAQESSRLIAEVSGNSINMGAFNNSAAVDVIAREGSARLDLRLLNNVIDSTDTNTLADINLQSGSSSANIETNQIYAYIANNNLTLGASPVVLRLRVSETDNTHDPRIFLQGFVEGGAGLDDDAIATWNANGNTPGANTGNITVSLSGTATAPSAGNAVAPSNPVP